MLSNASSRANVMVETGEVDRFNWRLPLYAALATFVIFCLIAFWQSESIVYLLVVVPFVSLSLCILLIRAAARRKLAGFLSILSMLIIFWAVSAILFENYFVIHTTARWVCLSREYKAKVLAQPATVPGELKHIEWDGWGWAGINTEVFLVFDPTDSLLVAAQSHEPGRFRGIPCEVYSVHRLESHWYTAQFYTGESWGECKASILSPVESK
jgi:hypothetical protein